jgi:KaiC/GvpD/RAD55 family RecA-like ATPase
MRIPENKKRVLIHGWRLEGEDEVSFEEFLKEIEEIKEKITGKEGYVYFELEYADDTSWLDDIHFYEIRDKSPEDIESEKKKKEEDTRRQELHDLLQYEKLKAKFEGGK